MGEMEYILARKVLRLANLITANRNTDIKELGLTGGQADSLLYFSKNEGKSVVDLKEHLGITHQTARGIVERMVKKGILETNISKEDARYKKVVLTKKGWELCKRLKENGMHTGDRLVNGMSESEKKQFFSMITLAVENLESID